uniref:Uncharacterized protein n=1 Tax=Rhizophora mucronata TaxID=61149 RepID=A0A2P2R1H5_RHIMU
MEMVPCKQFELLIYHRWTCVFRVWPLHSGVTQQISMLGAIILPIF